MGERNEFKPEMKYHKTVNPANGTRDAPSRLRCAFAGKCSQRRPSALGKPHSYPISPVMMDYSPERKILVDMVWKLKLTHVP